MTMRAQAIAEDAAGKRFIVRLSDADPADKDGTLQIGCLAAPGWTGDPHLIDTLLAMTEMTVWHPVADHETARAAEARVAETYAQNNHFAERYRYLRERAKIIDGL